MKFSFPVIPEHFSLPRLWSQLIKDLSCSTSVWKKTVNRSRFYSHLFNHNCTSVKQVLVLLFTNQFASCVMVLMFMYSTSCYCWAGLIDYYIMWVCKLPRNIFFFLIIRSTDLSWWIQSAQILTADQTWQTEHLT